MDIKSLKIPEGIIGGRKSKKDRQYNVKKKTVKQQCKTNPTKHREKSG
jgi:hypothetical protein